MALDGRIFSGVSVLAAVVEGGSFVKAAGLLGLTDSGVSRAIKRLETRLGIRLLDRTTRSVGLTDEGRRFYEEVKSHLDAIEDAAAIASGATSAVRGRLRVAYSPENLWSVRQKDFCNTICQEQPFGGLSGSAMTSPSDST